MAYISMSFCDYLHYLCCYSSKRAMLVLCCCTVQLFTYFILDRSVGPTDCINTVIAKAMRKTYCIIIINWFWMIKFDDLLLLQFGNGNCFQHFIG